MKNYLFLAVLMLLIHYAFPLSLSEHQAAQPQVCWRNTIFKRRATFPTCPLGVRIGDKCYYVCPLGYSRIGNDCYQRCPPGVIWVQDGMTCKMQFSRAGYARTASQNQKDDDSGMINRCQTNHGKDGCQRYNDMVYSKCQGEFAPRGCCVCRAKPECKDFGLETYDQYSCLRKVSKGESVPLKCGIGEKKGQLCYSQCDEKFIDLGPSCIQERGGPKYTNWGSCNNFFLYAKKSKLCYQVPQQKLIEIGQKAIYISYQLGPKLNAIKQKNYLFEKKLVQQLSKLQKLTSNDKQFLELVAKYKNDFPSMRKGGNIGDILSIQGHIRGNSLQIQDIIRICDQAVYLINRKIQSRYPNCKSLK